MASFHFNEEGRALFFGDDYLVEFKEERFWASWAAPDTFWKCCHCKEVLPQFTIPEDPEDWSGKSRPWQEARICRGCDKIYCDKCLFGKDYEEKEGTEFEGEDELTYCLYCGHSEIGKNIKGEEEENTDDGDGDNNKEKTD